MPTMEAVEEERQTHIFLRKSTISGLRVIVLVSSSSPHPLEPLPLMARARRTQ